MTEEKRLEESFGKAVREARKKSGIKAGDLARSIDVSDGTMANIEKGKVHVSLENAVKIAEILEIPLDVLLQDVYTPKVSGDHKVSVLWAEYRRIIEQLYDTAGNAAIEASIEKAMIMAIETQSKKSRTKKRKNGC